MVLHNGTVLKAFDALAKYIQEKKGLNRDEYDMYTVWFCDILGGWKTLMSTSIDDGMYYELTYSHDDNLIYVDAYRKEGQLVLYGSFNE